MLSKEDILNKKIKYEREVGIYFLIKEEEIVYIGQSISISSRICSHSTSRLKDFDSYYFVNCFREELDELETKYIYKFMPRHNLYNSKLGREKKRYVFPCKKTWESLKKEKSAL